MIFDASVLGNSALPAVIIIGSGPAGVTLAVSLADQGIDSLILEAGVEGFDPGIQDIYAGQVNGDPYYALDATRFRMLGGSSNHWQGRCRYLDPIDFEERPGVPGGTWPISKSDLDPYLDRARAMLNRTAPADQRDLSADIREISYDKGANHLNAWDDYKARFESSARMHVLPGAAVEHLEATGGRVSRIGVQLAGRQTVLEPPGVVVLACGGIENSRLLLWSNVVSRDRVVAEPATLGRYWMEHPEHHLGEAFWARRPRSFGDGWFDIAMAPTEAALRRHAIGNVVNFIWYDEARFPVGLGCRADAAAMQQLAERGWPFSCVGQVRTVFEQIPDPENRIALSRTARDLFGVPRVELNWRKSEADYRTARIGFELLGAHMAQARLGALRAFDQTVARTPFPETTIPGGNHHLGGTRMSHTPATGNVDMHNKVHGSANLYVAGSSVFPSGGHANPTFTIVQLSMRLADHLARTL